MTVTIAPQTDEVHIEVTTHKLPFLTVRPDVSNVAAVLEQAGICTVTVETAGSPRSLC